MAIDEQTVKKVARLARMKVNEADLPQLAGEMSKIVGWIEQLNEVDTKGVAPLTSVVSSALFLRKDVVTDGNQQQQILANAPESAEGFFVVPKVVE